MHRERFSGLATFAVVSDALVLFVAFFAAHFLVNAFKQYLPSPYLAKQLFELSHYGWLFVLDLCASLALLYLFGFYTFGRTLSYFDIVIGVMKAVVLAFLLLIAWLFITRIQDVSRLLLGAYSLVKLLLLIVEKSLIKAILAKLQEHGYNRINALVIGADEHAAAFVRRLHGRRELGYELVGVLADEPETAGRSVEGVPVIGRVAELYDLLTRHSVDEVFFALPIEEATNINEMVFACEEVGVRFSVIADWFKPNIARTSLRNLDDIPLLTFSTTPSQIGQLLLKTLLDRIAAGVGLIVISPLLAAIAVIIKLTSPGPVFFTQPRSGLNGRVFTFFKFRTMVENAEELKEELAARNEMSGPVFKMSRDPRVTPIGRWLRRYSLDELPQLFNVLKGEMSLVGPRPPIPEEVAKYERWQRRRLSMKPGLTCFWQIGGRNEIDFDEWMALDLKYIDNWSIKLDLIILLKTIPVVLSGKGAR
jgi:exopolysaccharide biosynthesis polyprenyl glycosylphosphotransferase